MIASFRINRFDELNSTQTYAKEQFVNGQLHSGDVFIAKTQSSGHGRYDRKWISPEGNIYMTIALELPIPHDKWGQMSYLIAISVSEAISFIDNCIDIKHKWVNDLLIGDKKFCGILLENLKDKMLLIGIGVNLIYSPQMEELNATALDRHSDKIKYELLLSAILERIKSNCATYLNFGFVPIKNLWLKRAYRLNDTITVRFQDHEQHGRFIGIDDDGRLQLFSNNKISLISAGELFFHS